MQPLCPPACRFWVIQCQSRDDLNRWFEQLRDLKITSYNELAQAPSPNETHFFLVVFETEAQSHQIPIQHVSKVWPSESAIVFTDINFTVAGIVSNEIEVDPAIFIEDFEKFMQHETHFSLFTERLLSLPWKEFTHPRRTWSTTQVEIFGFKAPLLFWCEALLPYHWNTLYRLQVNNIRRSYSNCTNSKVVWSHMIILTFDADIVYDLGKVIDAIFNLDSKMHNDQDSCAFLFKHAFCICASVSEGNSLCVSWNHRTPVELYDYQLMNLEQKLKTFVYKRIQGLCTNLKDVKFTLHWTASNDPLFYPVQMLLTRKCMTGCLLAGDSLRTKIFRAKVTDESSISDENHQIELLTSATLKIFQIIGNKMQGWSHIKVPTTAEKSTPAIGTSTNKLHYKKRNLSESKYQPGPSGGAQEDVDTSQQHQSQAQDEDHPVKKLKIETSTQKIDRSVGLLQSELLTNIQSILGKHQSSLVSFGKDLERKILDMVTRVQAESVQRVTTHTSFVVNNLRKTTEQMIIERENFVNKQSKVILNQEERNFALNEKLDALLEKFDIISSHLPGNDALLSGTPNQFLTKFDGGSDLADLETCFNPKDSVKDLEAFARQQNAMMQYLCQHGIPPQIKNSKLVRSGNPLSIPVLYPNMFIKERKPSLKMYKNQIKALRDSDKTSKRPSQAESHKRNPSLLNY